MNKIKCLILIFTILLIFNTTFALDYDVPKKPASVDIADIDLDGDLDIVLGHKVNWGYSNPSISILNNNNGCFVIIDTSIIYCGNQVDIKVQNLNYDTFPDIISLMLDFSSGIEDRYIRIIYNQNGIFSEFYDVSLNTEMVISGFDILCINNNFDISIISNEGWFMGILYNDGTGQFSSPEYYFLDYPPTDLAVGDLNGDDRDDILIVGGQKLDAWLNYETGLEYTNIIDSTYAHHAEISDIDNDGDNDIVATFWGMSGSPKKILTFSNDGFGNFTLSYNKWIDEAMANIFISDLNNDNYPDIIYNCSLHYPNSDYEIFHTYILFNNQDGTFQDPVNYYTGICSHKSHSADLDGNGWNDIITLNYDFYNPPPDTGTIHILFNDGTGNFVEDPQVGVEPQYQPISETTLSIYPNPFKINTMINFSIKEHGFVELKIYDIKGRLIKQIINQKIQGCEHNVTWNGKDENNKRCGSGIYLMNMKLDGVSKKVEKVILLK